MTKYYTAIGKFIHPSEGQGNLNPSVVVGRNEYLLDPQELIIWASLSWRFLKLEEIGKYYENETKEFDYTNDRSWQDCINRLMVRGLVVSGSGETDYCAGETLREIARSDNMKLKQVRQVLYDAYTALKQLCYINDKGGKNE